MTKRPMSERVLDCFPAGTYALHTLLRLLDVVETEDIPTAAVECRQEPRLLINPAFVAHHAPTPEKLLMLVLHELHHVLLGHTRLFPRVTPVDNLVFDAIINSLLCRMFPRPEHTAFFTDYYSDEKFPECLLRPIRGWPLPVTPGLSPRKRDLLPPVISRSRQRDLANVYLALYSPAGAGYEELYEVFRREIEQAMAALVPVLGDHSAADKNGDNSSDGNLEERSPILIDIVRQIVERWPTPPDPIRGRSLADILHSETVAPTRSACNRAVLRRLLRRVGGSDASDGPFRSIVPAPSAIVTPIPAWDRRSVVLRSLGAPPLLYNSEMPQRRRLPAGERVHVYVDVSASVVGLRGALYGAVLDCGEMVHPVVHLFSTSVVDVSLSELRRGRCETTGGTWIGCVAEHIRAHRVRRAALVTDGYVGKPTGGDQETLAHVRLGVALTPDDACRTDLDEVADFWDKLFSVNKHEPSEGRL